MRNIKKMPNVGGTTIVDIYGAAGGEVSEDGTHVVIDPAKTKPFKIELLVIPMEIASRYDEPDEVTFGVILHDEVAFEEEPMGVKVLTHSFDAKITLPVSQVKIIKEEADGA